MNINADSITAGAAVASVVVPIFGYWISGIKRTQITLFSKHDQLNKELTDYKLEVAKTYINREALNEALAPIKDTLKEIRQDLHNDRRDNPHGS